MQTSNNKWSRIIDCKNRVRQKLYGFIITGMIFRTAKCRYCLTQGRIFTLHGAKHSTDEGEIWRGTVDYTWIYPS